MPGGPITHHEPQLILSSSRPLPSPTNTLCSRAAVATNFTLWFGHIVMSSIVPRASLEGTQLDPSDDPSAGLSALGGASPSVTAAKTALAPPGPSPALPSTRNIHKETHPNTQPTWPLFFLRHYMMAHPSLQWLFLFTAEFVLILLFLSAFVASSGVPLSKQKMLRFREMEKVDIPLNASRRLSTDRK